MILITQIILISLINVKININLLTLQEHVLIVRSLTKRSKEVLMCVETVPTGKSINLAINNALTVQQLHSVKI